MGIAIMIDKKRLLREIHRRAEITLHAGELLVTILRVAIAWTRALVRRIGDLGQDKPDKDRARKPFSIRFLTDQTAKAR